MTGVKKRTICTWAAAAVLIFAAVACRLLDMLYIHSDVMGLTRSAIYIFLFSAWAVSVRNRIIHVRIRRYLSAMAAFMVFWFLIRTVKFHFSPELLSPHLPRCLWYLYYLPMLFIPMLAVLVAVSLGRPEALEKAALPFRFPDGKLWQFAESAVTGGDGCPYTQMQAIDLTGLHEKRAQLEQENRALAEAAGWTWC